MKMGRRLHRSSIRPFAPFAVSMRLCGRSRQADENHDSVAAGVR